MVREKVKLLRRILGLTQRQLAEYLKIAKATLVGIELGRSLPSKASLQLLQDHLGVNPEWFIKPDASLFIDPKKSLPFVLGKASLTRWELLFICEVMQQVWARNRCETRKEFIQKLILALNYIKTPPPTELKTFIAPPTTIVTETLAGTLANALRRIEEITTEQEKNLSEILLPWGYYVCKAYLTQELRYEPIPSLLFDNLQVTVGEKFEYTSRSDTVQVLFRNNKLHVYLKQGYFFIPAEKAFAFLVGVSALKEADNFVSVLDRLYLERKDETLRLLDYEFFFNPETRNSLITQGEVTLVISYPELQSLGGIVEEIKQNIFFWQYLQNLCVEKFGYV